MNLDEGVKDWSGTMPNSDLLYKTFMKHNPDVTTLIHLCEIWGAPIL
jgi:hypothetical protein